MCAKYRTLLFGAYLLALFIVFLQSKLENMGGVLYFIAPVFVLLICIVSEIAKRNLQIEKENRQPCKRKNNINSFNFAL